MPELPEVEVTRRVLVPHVEGQVLRQAVVREHRLRWPVPRRMDALLAGHAVQRLERRGKYLLWRFPHGTLISHLGMSGIWRLLPLPAAAPQTHDHVDLAFDRVIARLTDPRRFGALLWHPIDGGPLDAHPRLVGLGVEPFDAAFDADRLHAALRGRRVAIKPALLAGDIVVGVGNIYASESLFRARIHPATPAHRVGRPRCERLVDAVRGVLAEAIDAGGATMRDFVSAAGEEGYFLHGAAVYGRAGAACPRCAAVVRRIVQGQRATYYCPACQRP